MTGPYLLPDGFHGLFAYYPMFKKAASISTNLGCGREPTNCTDVCYDNENNEKYYGTVGGLKNVDALFDGTHPVYSPLNANGYEYFIKICDLEPDDFNYQYSNQLIFANNNLREPKDLVDPIVVTMSYDNLKWDVYLSTPGGWVPSWHFVGLLFSCIGALVLSILLALYLIENQRHKSLLRSMLPKHVINYLKYARESFNFAETFEHVTICFCDIVDYTVVCSTLTPHEVVGLLDELYGRFDVFACENNIYKVETIGDSYMCAAGAPIEEDASDAALRMISMAQAMLREVRVFESKFLPPGLKLQIRIGIHTGSVVAGVVGKQMPRYCLFGDSVNTAARMESVGEPMRIHVSDVTASLLRKRYVLDSRGEIFVKGKGRMNTYFIDIDTNLIANAQDINNSNSNSDDKQHQQHPVDVISQKLSGYNDDEKTQQKIPLHYLISKRLLDWDFDVRVISNVDHLITIILWIFEMMGTAGLQIDYIYMKNFVRAICNTYRDNSFHNIRHAVFVMQYVFMLLRSCHESTQSINNETEITPENFPSPSTLPQFTKFALLVAALAHDAGHPGNTNSYEKKIQSDRAVDANGESILEKYHINVLRKVIETQHGCNIISQFSESKRQDFWNIVETSILGTDMAVHDDIVSEIESWAKGEVILDFNKIDDQIALCHALLHCADLSNPVRDFKCSRFWSERIANEFTHQVARERREGIVPDAYMIQETILSQYKSEIGFIKYVGRPLWSALVTLYPSVSMLSRQLEDNVRHYEELVKEIEESDLMDAQRERAAPSNLSDAPSGNDNNKADHKEVGGGPISFTSKFTKVMPSV